METPYVERDCTFTHEGHSYEAGGAVVTDDYAIGYLGNHASVNPAAFDQWVITDWHGNDLGPARITAYWHMPHSYISNRQYQVEATINGVRYTGRTMGTGMIWRGRRMARQ